MLSLRELRRAARLLDGRLRGARLEKIVQHDAGRLVLSFRAAGDGDGRCHVLLECAPAFARLSQLRERPKAPRAPLPFALYLRPRLGRASCQGVRIVDEDRQAALRLSAGEAAFELLLSILGPRSNVYLLDGEGRLCQSLRPLARTRRGLAPGEPWSPPETPPPPPGEDRFAAVPDAEFFEAVERHYAAREVDERRAELAGRLRTALEREGRALQRKLAALRRDLEAAHGAEQDRHLGELLKGVLATLRPGASRAEAVDFATGERVEIPLDPTRSPAENLEAYFRRYQKRRRAVEHLEERIAALERERAQHAALQEEYRSELEGGRLDAAAFAERPPVRRLLERLPRAPAPPARRARGPLAQVPARLAPRRYRSSDGLEIWVGRSDEGNDHLTTRLARGNDLFLHLEGSPGSHVVLRTGGRPDPPAESLLEAAELAVHFSKQREATRCDVHVVPIRNVSKPRGAPPGLVSVRGGRTVHLRRQRERLERVLAARLDE